MEQDHDVHPVVSPGYGSSAYDRKVDRALAILKTLANTPPTDWQSKREIHAALAEFR